MPYGFFLFIEWGVIDRELKWIFGIFVAVFLYWTSNRKERKMFWLIRNWIIWSLLMWSHFRHRVENLRFCCCCYFCRVFILYFNTSAFDTCIYRDKRERETNMRPHSLDRWYFALCTKCVCVLCLWWTNTPTDGGVFIFKKIHSNINIVRPGQTRSEPYAIDAHCKGSNTKKIDTFMHMVNWKICSLARFISKNDLKMCR